MTRYWVMTAVVVALTVMFGPVGCHSHHIRGQASVAQAAEHPEHPASAAKPKPLTMDDVAVAIEGYIKDDTALKGGYFLYYDAAKKEVLMLALDKVHRERLAKTAADTYFACSDFKTPEGKVYDLDFWMKGTAEGQLKVTEIMVHKEAGKPRYNWVEEGGIWKRQPVGD